jgi:glycosyltransferase involved in cell wall biosynthesis
MSALISVIIPVYNGEKTLVKCISSVLNQTYKNYEVIIIDNNSTDNTKKIIFGFMEKNDKIRYIFEPKKSRGAARNKGISFARGKIICMTDSDCIVASNWIEVLTLPIRAEEEVAVMGFEKYPAPNYWTRNLISEEYEYSYYKKDRGYASHIDTKNFAVKSEILKRLMFDPYFKRCEDVDFTLRFKQHYKVLFLPSIKVIHNQCYSLISLIRLQISRAYWTNMVYNRFQWNSIKYPDIPKKRPSLKNLLLTLCWISKLCLKGRKAHFFYKIVSSFSQEIGGIISEMDIKNK